MCLNVTEHNRQVTVPQSQMCTGSRINRAPPVATHIHTRIGCAGSEHVPFGQQRKVPIRWCPCLSGSRLGDSYALKSPATESNLAGTARDLATYMYVCTAQPWPAWLYQGAQAQVQDAAGPDHVLPAQMRHSGITLVSDCAPFWAVCSSIDTVLILATLHIRSSQ